MDNLNLTQQQYQITTHKKVEIFNTTTSPSWTPVFPMNHPTQLQHNEFQQHMHQHQPQENFSSYTDQGHATSQYTNEVDDRTEENKVSKAFLKLLTQLCLLQVSYISKTQIQQVKFLSCAHSHQHLFFINCNCSLTIRLNNYTPMLCATLNR